MIPQHGSTKTTSKYTLDRQVTGLASKAFSPVPNIETVKRHERETLKTYMDVFLIDSSAPEGQSSRLPRESNLHVLPYSGGGYPGVTHFLWCTADSRLSPFNKPTYVTNDPHQQSWRCPSVRLHVLVARVCARSQRVQKPIKDLRLYQAVEFQIIFVN